MSVAIRVEGLGRYVGARLEMDGVARPREAFRSLMRIAGVELAPSGDDPQVTYAVAGYLLREITFDVEWGSVVCLVGPSDSGKGLLLQVLAGAVPPTEGRAEIYGPVTPILSIGDNLNPRFTAHENIKESPYWTGAATPEDARRYMQDVLDFAELYEFEHAPIRTFSTGMVVRLGLALALCGQPSIVLIDDVLTVGDIGFQQKCVERVRALKAAGCTLVLAFGDDALVQQFATRVITMSGGRVVNDTASGTAAVDDAQAAADVEWRVSKSLAENDVIALTDVDVRALDGEGGIDLEVATTFAPRADGLRCRPLVSVESRSTGLFRSLYPAFVPVSRQDVRRFAVRVPTSVLPEGEYTIGVHLAAVEGAHVHAMKVSEAVSLTIRRPGPETPAAEPRPLLRLPVTWETESLSEGTA